MQNLMLHDLSIVVNNISTKTKFGRSYDSAITHKVRSTDGASLSIALLLFLVCAVVGSVVLAAATAASGRLAKMAEMDQRYYSVTSAAELLAEELNGQTVSVMQIKTVTKTTTQSYSIKQDSSGKTTVEKGAKSEPPANETFETEVNWYISDKPKEKVKVDPASPSLLTDIALKMFYGDKEQNTSDAMNCSFKNSQMLDEDVSSKGFTLEPDSVTYNSLKVYGRYIIAADGSIDFYLSDSELNNDGSPKQIEQYILVLNLKPTVMEAIETTDSNPKITYINGSGGYSIETVETTEITKESQITWKVYGFHKKQ